jgi:erythritol transport system substrate-binding protein
MKGSYFTNFYFKEENSMKWSKRALAMMTASMMVAGLAAGCGSSSKPAETTKAAETTAVAETTVAATAAAETVESKTTAAAAESKEVLPGGGSNIMYIISPSVSNPAFKAEVDNATSKAQELGYEVKAVSHDDDPTKQTELFDSAISDKAAAIICDNAGADATIEAVKKAAAAGIPTFLIDREITENGVAVAQIIADNNQGAAAIAEEWVEAMNEKGNYVELLGKDSDTNAHVRTEAFHSVIDEYPDLVMLEQQTANWEQTEAYDKMGTLIQTYGDKINGVICGNDTMLQGACAALKEADMNVPVIGVDGSDEAAALIKSGEATGTALQQFAVIAQTAVEEADAYLKNGTVPEEEKQLIPCVAITADNVDKLSGFVYTE